VSLPAIVYTKYRDPNVHYYNFSSTKLFDGFLIRDIRAHRNHAYSRLLRVPISYDGSGVSPYSEST
jgi:hypothetical protein